MLRATRAALLLAFSLLLLVPLACAKSSISMDLAMDEKYTKPQTAVAFPATFSAVRPVRVVFEVVHADGGLLAPVPNPVDLPTREGGAATIPLTIQSPYRNGHMDQTGKVAYRATPSDGSAPLEWTLTLHTKGFYLPGPGVALLLGALAAVAGIARRRG